MPTLSASDRTDFKSHYRTKRYRRKVAPETNFGPAIAGLMDEVTTANASLATLSKRTTAPTYADDAAANADATLLSGDYYRTTGGGVALFRKV